MKKISKTVPSTVGKASAPGKAEREFKATEDQTKAAIAVGADGLFIETHPNPSVAKSDGANMLPLDQLEALLEKLLKVREAIA